MKDAPMDRLAAARSGYDTVHAAVLQYDRGLLIESFVVEQFGRIDLVVRYGCDPDEDTAGTSGISSCSTLDAALIELDEVVDTNRRDGALDARMALLLRTKDDEGHGDWVASQERSVEKTALETDARAYLDVQEALEDAAIVMRTTGAKDIEAVPVLLHSDGSRSAAPGLPLHHGAMQDLVDHSVYSNLDEGRPAPR